MDAKGLGKTVIDPLGLGFGDAIFGKSDGPDYSQYEDAEKAALDKSQAAADDFAKGGPAKYDWQTLAAPEQQGDTQLGSVTTDPRYKEAELSALSSLEDQGKNGFTAQNRADQVESENQANAANRGRIGAIQQNMQARGAGGSGMDLVAQLQSAQNSNDTEAMRALETEANKERSQQAATAQAGSLAGTLQNQEYNQAANRAQAQDAINRFNTSTTNQNNAYNNQGQNSTAHDNSSAAYGFQKDVLGTKQGAAGTAYSAAAEGENRARLGAQADEAAAAGKGALVGQIGGAAIGGMVGGPMGAAAGASIGGSVGGQVGRTASRNSYWHGGKVPDDAPFAGDDPRNDTHNINVAGGEIVVPRTAAKNPAKAAKFAADAAGSDHDDVVGHLLAAMSKLHGKGKK
jgi:hypothetical protein